MNLDAYQKFIRYIKAFQINTEQGNFDTIIDRTAKTGASIPINKFKNPIEFQKLKMRHIMNLSMSEAWLDTATPYEVDEKIMKICAFCKVPKTIKEFLFLPRNPMFIDVEFNQQDYDISDRHIIGILLGERPLTLAGKDDLQDPLASTHANTDYDIINEVAEIVKDKKLQGNMDEQEIKILKELNEKITDITDNKYKVTGKTIGAYMVVENQQGDIFLDSISFNHKINKEYQKANVIQTRLPTSKFIENFVLNILNFMNNKEVAFVEHKRDDNNKERRLRQGKIVLPTSQIIRVTGLLKKYIDDASSKGGGWHYSFQFPVSAHKRHYKNGKIIKIEQFNKGQGIYIDKKRRVVADKNHPDVQRWNEENLDYSDIEPLDEPLRDKKTRGEA
jgi:hypothetical protein